jgi:hypothetical protein
MPKPGYFVCEVRMIMPGLTINNNKVRIEGTSYLKLFIYSGIPITLSQDKTFIVLSAVMKWFMTIRFCCLSTIKQKLS